ncbi:E3 ubiquitin-protein ligase rfwd3.L-like [Tubulanus polymorphus]|uniref:E3 ubiquitin-protein ligase rfwd3.L-like n=1 Tax=Tubulanus polymorphus TaxID=672921 RepID=UPI003DA2F0BF
MENNSSSSDSNYQSGDNAELQEADDSQRNSGNVINFRFGERGLGIITIRGNLPAAPSPTLVACNEPSSSNQRQPTPRIVLSESMSFVAPSQLRRAAGVSLIRPAATFSLQQQQHQPPVASSSTVAPVFVSSSIQPSTSTRPAESSQNQPNNLVPSSLHTAAVQPQNITQPVSTVPAVGLNVEIIDVDSTTEEDTDGDDDDSSSSVGEDAMNDNEQERSMEVEEGSTAADHIQPVAQTLQNIPAQQGSVNPVQSSSGTPGPSSAPAAGPSSAPAPGPSSAPAPGSLSTPVQTSSLAAARAMLSPEQDDDSECCPICFESWSTSGEHRICSLKCGHLFGLSCIEKWLQGQGSRCPHCNSKATRKDIRVIYAKSVRALDTTDRDRAVADLEKEREARRRAEMEAAQSRVQYQMMIDECRRLKEQLDTRQQQLTNLRESGVALNNAPAGGTPHNAQPNQQQATAKQCYLLERTIEISRAGNCRVMTFCGQIGALVISKPSANPLFPGYGIQKVSCLDLRATQYTAVHQNSIRDIAVHPLSHDSLLLSGSLDKTVKLTSLISNTVVQTYNAPSGVWSCTWNLADRNYMYAGLANGTVVVYDIRNTSEHVQLLNTNGSRKPVVGLQYMPMEYRENITPGGLLVGQLDSTSFFETKEENDYKIHILALEGSMTSLALDPSTKTLLGSFRPMSTAPSVRHEVCSMQRTKLNLHDNDDDDLIWQCATVKTLYGGSTMKLLSRSTIYSHPVIDGHLLVCAGDEASGKSFIWDASTGEIIQRLDNGGVPVLQSCAYTLNNQHFLASLTERNLRVFKWT